MVVFYAYNSDGLLTVKGLNNFRRKSVEIKTVVPTACAFRYSQLCMVWC